MIQTHLATVWVLIIQHRHGEDITVHGTEQHAKTAVVEYVDHWWDDEMTPDAVKPTDEDERVKAYFEYTEDYEHYSLVEAVVEGT